MSIRRMVTVASVNELRIPMRGYEFLEFLGKSRLNFVTNPHAGL